LTGLAELAARQRALVEVTPGTEGALRLLRRAIPAAQGHLVPYVDREILADELASYGPEVRVVEPADLREAVISRLRSVVAAHEGGVAREAGDPAPTGRRAGAAHEGGRA
jgi:proteasome accessory factor B